MSDWLYGTCKEIGEQECCRLIRPHAQQYGWTSFWRLQQHVFCGRSYRDIAQESGVGSNTVRLSCIQAARRIFVRLQGERAAKERIDAQTLKWIAKNIELIELAHVRLHNLYYMDRTVTC